MTNEDYIQWEPLIKKVAYKYRDNVFGLEIDDLIQIGAMGLMRGFDTYKEGAGASQKTYFYNCIEWKILREFENLRRAKRFCLDTVSLDMPTDKDEDQVLADIVEDKKVHVENMIIDEIETKKIIDEIERVLTGNDKDVIMYKLFDNLNNHEIAIALDIEEEKVPVIYRAAKEKLRRKSYYIQFEYFKHLLCNLRVVTHRNMVSYIAYKDRVKYLSNLLIRLNKKNKSLAN